jgi:hypothetical protein
VVVLLSDESREDALEYVSGIQDFIDLHHAAGDDELQKAINLAMKCIAKPDLPHAAARKAMVQLQGYAFKFKMQALVYMQIHTGKTGSNENIKKNAYMYASEQCDKLAQTLKYLVRETL